MEVNRLVLDFSEKIELLATPQLKEWLRLIQILWDPLQLDGKCKNIFICFIQPSYLLNSTIFKQGPEESRDQNDVGREDFGAFGASSHDFSEQQVHQQEEER